MQLSEHFTLEEMCFSETAARLGLNNDPPPEIVANLYRTAMVMEAVRKLLNDQPIFVHSGYRSAAVDRAVGGVTTSAHCRGLACDFVCRLFGTPLEVALAIRDSPVEFDQLILEYGWVHMGLVQAGRVARHETLTKAWASAAYQPGICAAGIRG